MDKNKNKNILIWIYKIYVILSEENRMHENGISDSKKAVLAVLEILKRYTDVDHTISNVKIRKILEKKYDIKTP